MTACLACSTHLAEIQRLVGELAKARAEAGAAIRERENAVTKAEAAEVVSQSYRRHGTVWYAEKALIEAQSAMAAADASEMIAHLRRVIGEARETLVDGGAWGCETLTAAAGRLTADRDTARAEVSRLKAGLREMRTVVAGPHEIEWHHTVRMIDALLKESP